MVLNLEPIKKKILKLIGEEFWVEKNGVEFMRIYGDFTEHDYQFEIKGAQRCFCGQEMGNIARSNRYINNK